MIDYIGEKIALIWQHLGFGIHDPLYVFPEEHIGYMELVELRMKI